MKRSHNQRCHKNIHGGRLKVEGQAGGRLRWSNRWGQAMTAFPGYRYPPQLSDWFEAGLEARVLRTVDRVANLTNEKS